MIAEPKPPSGLSAEASWHRQLLRWVKGWFVLSIEGYRITETTNGRVFKKESVSVAPSTPFTQVPGMHPFRIYKPNPLPPDGTAVTTFDSSGNPVAAIVNSLIPTNESAIPPTYNPLTDAWRFWCVRNGMVEIRPWFKYFDYDSTLAAGAEIAENNSFLFYVWTGTDDINPVDSYLPYDSPVTYPQSSGTILVIPGVPVVTEAGGFIAFSIWLEITPDTADYGGDLGLAIKGWRTDGEIGTNPFPDSSSLIIPIGYMESNIAPFFVGGQIDTYNLIVSQYVFDHIRNRWPPGMYGENGIGALSYRGDWDADDIQDMVFYPGDVIRKKAVVNVSGNNDWFFDAVSLYMSNGICFTDDPEFDDNFTWISGAVTP